jgi:hypothetical protein
MPKYISLICKYLQEQLEDILFIYRTILFDFVKFNILKKNYITIKIYYSNCY